jgi:integrase
MPWSLASRRERSLGVQIADEQRFGLHNLRHSLSNWLVNKAKIETQNCAGHPASEQNTDDA